MRTYHIPCLNVCVIQIGVLRQSGEALDNNGDRTDLHLWYGGDALVGPFSSALVFCSDSLKRDRLTPLLAYAPTPSSLSTQLARSTWLGPLTQILLVSSTPVSLESKVVRLLLMFSLVPITPVEGCPSVSRRMKLLMEHPLRHKARTQT